MPLRRMLSWKLTFVGAAVLQPIVAAPALSCRADDAPAEGATVAASVVEETLDFAAVRQTLVGSCVDCHDEGAAEGGFSLASITSEESLTAAHDQWMQVRSRLADGSMPPDDAEPLELDERMRVIHGLDAALREAFHRSGQSAGPAMVRRLTAHEYSNTVRDLLEVHFDAGYALPQDVAGGEGFTNAAETLTISPIHAEKYLDAATAALTYAASDSAARNRLFPQRPSQEENAVEAAKANLTTLIGRAFRRPADKHDVKLYSRLFIEAQKDGLNFEDASYYAMRAVLSAPEFLFLAESPPAKRGAEEPVTPYELASRLSYFLWASMPDQTLSESAASGRLGDPEELKNQTLRMLGEGTKLNDSLVEFVGQWLGTADLGSSKQADPERHPWVKDHHIAAMRNQPVYLLERILRENRSLLELIDADGTYLCDELIHVYGLDRDKIDEKKFNQNLEYVTLPEEYRRHCGLVGAGGVMLLTSYPHRTSPVLRGVWVLDKMLGVKLPPPPPAVPKLDESAEVAKADTLRERFERHRADAACASCHNRMDPIGFALENFDELGRWRDHDEGGPIDPRTQLHGGIEIDGVAGLKQYLLQNQTQFLRHLTQKMLGYALARGLRPADQATVEEIVVRLEANECRAHELLLGIVESKPFRFKGSSP